MPLKFTLRTPNIYDEGMPNKKNKTTNIFVQLLVMGIIDMVSDTPGVIMCTHTTPRDG